MATTVALHEPVSVLPPLADARYTIGDVFEYGLLTCSGVDLVRLGCSNVLPLGNGGWQAAVKKQLGLERGFAVVGNLSQGLGPACQRYRGLLFAMFAAPKCQQNVYFESTKEPAGRSQKDRNCRRAHAKTS